MDIDGYPIRSVNPHDSLIRRDGITHPVGAIGGVGDMVDLIQQKIRAQEEEIKHLEGVMNLCEDKVGMVAVSCQVAILTRQGFICELRELL